MESLHSYDIGPDSLAWALARSPSPELLLALVDRARNQFGWFSKQTSRTFELPWVVNQIGQTTSNRILDIGAGVSALPLFLAERGAEVVTVDDSTIIRKLGEDQANWNDWGFLDYARINSNIHSIHDDILRVGFSNSSFALIYSVSVIEHMPSYKRKQLWSKVEKCLARDGVLLLTVDLVTSSEQLWNYNYGEIVEPLIEHGDLATLEQELSQVGFKLTEHQILRELLESRVDCALMRFARD